MRNKIIDIDISKQELINFLEKVKELNKVSEYHRVKFSPEHTIVYSKDGENDKVNKIRVYLLKEKLFKKFPDVTLIWTILDGKNWYNQFNFLLDDDLEFYSFSFEYNEADNAIISVEGKNNTLVLRSICGDNDLINRDLTLDIIKQTMNPKLCDWFVPINKEVLDKVIKLSKLETDSLIRVIIEDNKVYFKQNKWNLFIGETDYVNQLKMFDKENLSIISKEVELFDFCMFDTYILLNEKNSLLLYSLELTD